MRPSDTVTALRDLLPSGVPVYLQGPPGVGKSSLVWQAASALFDGQTLDSTVGGLPDVPWYYALRATDRDPVDLRGLPTIINGATVWARPDLLDVMRAPSGVLCIEELPQAIAAVQCVLRELLLDRRIGGHRIPDEWWVCATGNRSEDRAGAQRLLSHVASACVILDVEVSNDDWHTWALQAKISPDVRSFLKFRPAMLHDFNPARQLNADPRGWERVSRVAARVSREDLLLPVVKGCVGDVAAEYIAFRQIYTKLPNPELIIADPKGSAIPKEPAVLFALCGALAEAARTAVGKNLAALVTYAARLTDEWSMLLMRDMTIVNGKTISIPEAQPWLRANKNLLVQQAA